MGWCSATDIMDAAVKAAEAVAREALGIALDEHRCCGGPDEWLAQPEVAAKLDDALRPFVRSIARKLHDGDWDCVDEAEAFDRFPQEMYDHDDQEHERWIRDRLQDVTWAGETAEVARWAGILKAHTDKMEASKH